MSSFFIVRLNQSFHNRETMNFAGTSMDMSVPRVMGILNVTPDSFSDGGELLGGAGKVSLDKALFRARAMHEAGADFIDIGGESTRPGALTVSLQEELDRVLPVASAVAQELDVIVSVDTSSPELMREAARVGVGMINDVRALQQDGALLAVRETGLPVCLMHMQGQPDSMQDAPRYENIVAEVIAFLKARVESCMEAGIDRHNIIIDPGFGFGKTLQHNLELLGRLDAFKTLNLPVLIGLSRKRMLGTLTGRTEKERLAAGIAVAVMGLERGARIIRTHDVRETVDAVKLFTAVADQINS